MILGTTLRVIAKQCPGYRIVPAGIANYSVSVCCCSKCKSAQKNGHEFANKFVCGRVIGRLDESERGHAIVAWNGSCDRAEFKKCDGDFELKEN